MGTVLSKVLWHSLVREFPPVGEFLQVTVSGDAIEVIGGGSDGVVVTTGTALGVQPDRLPGFRFALDLEQGSTVLNATIQFTSSVTTVTLGNGGCTATLWAEAADDASAFSTSSHNLTSRTKGSASTVWPMPPDWVIGDRTPAQKTPSIAALIQEVIDRPGWMSTQHLVILVVHTSLGEGARQVAAIEHATLQEAVLTIEYLPPES